MLALVFSQGCRNGSEKKPDLLQAPFPRFRKFVVFGQRGREYISSCRNSPYLLQIFIRTLYSVHI